MIKIPRRKRKPKMSLNGKSYTVRVGGKDVEIRGLLTPGSSNVKIRKSKQPGYMTWNLSLSPHTYSGAGNVCPSATTCADSCLDGCGNGGIFQAVQMARIAKTVLWFENRDAFLSILNAEISKAISQAAENNSQAVFRLNTFSDIPWESFVVPNHPDGLFYDYTKMVKRHGAVLPNYWVTLSRSEDNEAACLTALNQGSNVAVVFHNGEPVAGRASKNVTLPQRWNGWPVLDGDLSDERWADKGAFQGGGYVIGLRLKSLTNAASELAIQSGFAVYSE